MKEAIDNRPDRCGTCRFAEAVPMDADGYFDIVCRRHAPKPINLNVVHGYEKHTSWRTFDTGWPSVEDEDWCGEWKPEP